MREQDLAALTATDLANLATAVAAEQHRRALAEGNIDAIVEAAFDLAFDRSGKPLAPFIEHGLLVCPGFKKNRSATSHDCSFVAVNGRWTWETDHEADVVRQVPGQRKEIRSVTVLFADEGTKVDQVTSQSKGGQGCRMVSARAFVVTGGRLVEGVSAGLSAPTHR